MKKLAIDLTEKERENFYDYFYDNWNFDMDDTLTPNPFGCPWVWYREELEGDTVQEMANNFFNLQEDEIKFQYRNSLTIEIEEMENLLESVEENLVDNEISDDERLDLIDEQKALRFNIQRLMKIRAPLYFTGKGVGSEKTKI